MDLDLLRPWHGAGLAFAVTLAWALLFRALRRPDLAALGAGVGIAAGVLATLGAIPGSPRQLPERLPVLALAGTGLGLGLTLLGGERRGALVTIGAVLSVLAGAWWLAGGQMVLPDLRRGAVTLLALAVLIATLAMALDGPVPALASAALLVAGLSLSAPFGPWLVLAAVALGAVLGGLPAGSAWALPARLPVALGLAALIAGPVLARGRPVDWLAAAGPAVAPWAGPLLAARISMPGARFLGWIIACGLPLLFTWLTVRGP